MKYLIAMLLLSSCTTAQKIPAFQPFAGKLKGLPLGVSVETRDDETGVEISCKRTR